MFAWGCLCRTCRRLATLPAWPFCPPGHASGRCEARQGADFSWPSAIPTARCPISSNRRSPKAPPASATIPPSSAPKTGARRQRLAQPPLRAERRDRCGKKSAAAGRHPRGPVHGAVSLHAARAKAGARPIVAMPNPFYQCYAAAALGQRRRAALCAVAERERLPARFRRPARSDTGTAGRGLYLLALQSRRRGGRSRPIGTSCSRWPSATISSCWRMNVMPTSISAKQPTGALTARQAQSGGFTPPSRLSIPCPSVRACRACAPAWWRAMPR